MKLISQILGGHRAKNGPLLRKGKRTCFLNGKCGCENEACVQSFIRKDLSRSEREFLDAMIKAKVVRVLEDDPPAVIIPFPVATPSPEPDPVTFEAPVQQRGKVRRARKKVVSG